MLARVVGSMSEFKQIIGRGTRLRDDYGKLWFNILDYTGSATRMFADTDFDGEPTRITEEEIERGRRNRGDDRNRPRKEEPPPGRSASPGIIEPPHGRAAKILLRWRAGRDRGASGP